MKFKFKVLNEAIETNNTYIYQGGKEWPSRDIEEVIVKEGVTKIPSRKFQYSSNLRKVTIPASVEYIGSYAFYYCPNLVEVVIESGSRLSKVADCAFGLTGLSDADFLPETAVCHPDAFYKCSFYEKQEKASKYITYGIYTIDEEGSEIDHVSNKRTLTKAREYVKQYMQSEQFQSLEGVEGMHIVAIPNNEDDPDTREYFEYTSKYDMYEIIETHHAATKLEESSNKLEAALGSLTSTQIAYIKEYWNAFYNDPEKYSIYADMIKETMAEKGIE